MRLHTQNKFAYTTLTNNVYYVIDRSTEQPRLTETVGRRGYSSNLRWFPVF